ncbi:NEDD4-like E3 ubiquitin-protein ligase, partial [Melia azedarach]
RPHKSEPNIMKDLSFFLFKNYLGSKMKKGVRNFCSSDNSTSTLNQHENHMHTPPQDQRQQPTLEEMILQLELEEEIARQEKLNNKYNNVRGRMSCVNSSDILHSARNALNQYPRFSLDGKDAMYRSSFRNLENGRKSVGCDSYADYNNNNYKSTLAAGERVIWCKPGVVAKLMGLEAMPVVERRSKDYCAEKMKCSGIVKRQNLRRRAERHGIERRIVMENMRGKMGSSCSKGGYCVMKPAAAVDHHHHQPENVNGGWPTRRFR